MCGIAGYFGLGEKGRDAVVRAVEAQRHRGPDDGGVEYVAPGVILGHRRLSILDLSPLGHQPMKDANTGSWLVFNGEIYNFQSLKRDLEREGATFRGHSDTEVLLAGLVKHGNAFLSKLEGMFAFAFWDAPKNFLLVARDPMGIKPFYFYLKKDEFAFASETRALLAILGLKKEICPQGLSGFLQFGAVQHPQTLWIGIESLGPGEWMTIKRKADGDLAIEKEAYWKFPSQRPWTEGEAIEFLQRELPRAVRDHLVADVPVGIFLSSGIDSTILAGLASESHPGMQAYTVCFGDHKEFDEDRIAADTARRFGLKHERIVISEKEALDSFEGWLAAMDQPSIDGLNTFIISKAVRERGIKVALSGLGADELFGGYSTFDEITKWSPIIRKFSWMPRFIKYGIAKILTNYKGNKFSNKAAKAFSSNGSVDELYSIRREIYNCDFLLGENKKIESKEVSNIIKRVQLLELTKYMLNMLLRDTDYNSMSLGLEIRIPFLDKKIVEFALSLPGDVIRPKGSLGKNILRESMHKYLSNDINNQKKRGFVMPISKWLRGPLNGYLNGNVIKAEIISKEKITKLFKKFGIDNSIESQILGILSLSKFVV